MTVRIARGYSDMLIGAAGALPARPADISPADVGHLAALGFQGVSVTLGAPGEASRDDLQRARTIVADAGLTIAQANGAYGSLVGRSAADRRRGIDELIAHMQATNALSARTCYVRPGGLNPRGPGSPTRSTIWTPPSTARSTACAPPPVPPRTLALYWRSRDTCCRRSIDPSA